MHSPPQALAFRPWLLWLGASAISLAAFPVLGRSLPAIASYALGMTILTVLVLGVAAHAPLADRRRLGWALVPAMLPILVGLGRFGADAYLPAVLVLLGLMAAGTWIGGAIGRAIEHPGHLLPVAYVSSLADLYSVFGDGGPTGVILESHPDVLAVVALPWSFGTPEFFPILGVADVVMTALYLGVARTSGRNLRGMLFGLGLGYVALFVVLANAGRALPALPFLGAGVLVAYPDARRLRPHDRRIAITGMAIVTLVTAALYVFR